MKSHAFRVGKSGETPFVSLTESKRVTKYILVEQKSRPRLLLIFYLVAHVWPPDEPDDMKPKAKLQILLQILLFKSYLKSKMKPERT